MDGDFQALVRSALQRVQCPPAEHAALAKAIRRTPSYKEAERQAEGGTTTRCLMGILERAIGEAKGEV